MQQNSRMVSFLYLKPNIYKKKTILRSLHASNVYSDIVYPGERRFNTKPNIWFEKF